MRIQVQLLTRVLSGLIGGEEGGAEAFGIVLLRPFYGSSEFEK
ncbi:hypothetical protein M6B38_230425 [Iris pallida]|uniref:Uncharacterized protein n=1 Tax=Iris pallida TaxID=29817 RepID=A0AAX6DSE0_IRIPA|nr:hypothetical protein M6B38_230425 [Iris pallida]